MATSLETHKPPNIANDDMSDDSLSDYDETILEHAELLPNDTPTTVNTTNTTTTTTTAAATATATATTAAAANTNNNNNTSALFALSSNSRSSASPLPGRRKASNKRRFILPTSDDADEDEVDDDKMSINQNLSLQDSKVQSNGETNLTVMHKDDSPLYADIINAEYELDQVYTANMDKFIYGCDGDEPVLTPLMLAVRNNKSGVVKQLLDDGCNVNQSTPVSGNTALHFACRRGGGHPCIIRLLLLNGADRNIANKENITALDIGRKENIIIFDMDNKQLAKLDKANKHGETPLHRLAEAGTVQEMSNLLAQGAYINSQCNAEHTPLHKASLNGREDLVKVLLEAGAYPNIRNGDGETPLHDGCANDHLDVVRTLLASGADPRVSNTSGDLPRDKAVEDADSKKNVDEIVKLLDEQAKKFQEQCSEQFNGGDKSRTHSCRQSLVETSEIFRLLPVLGGSIRSSFESDNGSFNSLSTRSARRTPTPNSHLYDDPKYRYRDGTGKMMIHVAIETDNVEALANLLEQGADPQARDKRLRTPLHYAAKAGNTEAAKLLLEVYAKKEASNDVNLFDDQMKTPLHEAVGRYHPQMIDYLIEWGANANLQDLSGDRPVDIAIKRGLSLSDLEVKKLKRDLSSDGNITQDLGGGEEEEGNNMKMEDVEMSNGGSGRIAEEQEQEQNPKNASYEKIQSGTKSMHGHTQSDGDIRLPNSLLLPKRKARNIFANKIQLSIPRTFVKLGQVLQNGKTQHGRRHSVSSIEDREIRGFRMSRGLRKRASRPSPPAQSIQSSNGSSPTSKTKFSFSGLVSGFPITKPTSIATSIATATAVSKNEISPNGLSSVAGLTITKLENGSEESLSTTCSVPVCTQSYSDDSTNVHEMEDIRSLQVQTEPNTDNTTVPMKAPTPSRRKRHLLFKTIRLPKYAPCVTSSRYMSPAAANEKGAKGILEYFPGLNELKEEGDEDDNNNNSMGVNDSTDTKLRIRAVEDDQSQQHFHHGMSISDILN